MPRVTTIPATKNLFTALPTASVARRKVAGYARVSTDSDEQFTSYEAQIDYYTRYIMEREDWQFVKVYTDSGISATNTKHRDGFNEMVRDALAGKIDLIVTKSVSRFARNTVDSLTTVRNSSFEPVISNMVLECKAPVNIMFADTKNMDGKAYGQMILQLPEDERAAKRALAYLETQNVHAEEVADYASV